MRSLSEQEETATQPSNRASLQPSAPGEQRASQKYAHFQNFDEILQL